VSGVVEVVSAHHERAVVRVGDAFVKLDSEVENLRRERAAMACVPVPTPEVLWWNDGPPAALALGALSGSALGRFGEVSSHGPKVWARVGMVVRELHAAPMPDWLKTVGEACAARIDESKVWLLRHTSVRASVVEARAAYAHSVLDERRVESVFVHGDLQAAHVIVEGDEVAGIIDWSSDGAGDPLIDLAALTVGHQERVSAVLEGYGTDVDMDALRGYWTLWRMNGVRFMVEHGFDASGDLAALEMDLSV
jgi:aminoglycoside phosphotransferase (APT) family kinase protein